MRARKKRARVNADIRARARALSVPAGQHLKQWVETGRKKIEETEDKLLAHCARPNPQRAHTMKKSEVFGAWIGMHWLMRKHVSIFKEPKVHSTYRITSSNSRPLIIPAQGTRQNYIGILGKLFWYFLDLQSKNSQRIAWDHFVMQKACLKQGF